MKIVPLGPSAKVTFSSSKSGAGPGLAVTTGSTVGISVAVAVRVGTPVGVLLGRGVFVAAADGFAGP
ncbi:MAG: hypothetical protein JW929_04010, partial [Anaerolineales bacterium]|nr:hypothetical protein [Anaerolineales bacterium]